MNQTVVDIPRVYVDKPVSGGDEFDLSIPVTVPFVKELGTQWEITLAFYRNDGKQMGTPFKLVIALANEGDEQMKRAAAQLAEAQMGSFEECLSALVKCGGDEGAALQMLYSAKVDKQ
jgi:hypothetical protein